MCGIIAYAGSGGNATRMVLQGLKSLEYRGYDSAGVLAMSNGSFVVKKDVGRVGEIGRKLKLGSPASRLAMGHTRWATHGRVTRSNAHPQIDCDSSVAVVHNGIIDNCDELRGELERSGHVFSSETDTEVIPHMIEEQLKVHDSPVEACAAALKRLQGTFALAIAIAGLDNIIAVRKGSPLVVGIADNGSFAASDIPAFISYTNKVVYLYDYDIAVLGADPEFYSVATGRLARVSRDVSVVNADAKSMGKNGFEHYMMKEILEQVDTIKSTGAQNRARVERIARRIRRARRVLLIGCGSSYNACIAASHIFSELSVAHVSTVLASEIMSQRHLLGSGTLVIAVSQSGETYDVLNAVVVAKNAGSSVVSLCNVESSSLSRESDEMLSLNAGPEFAVLATKSYTSQLALLSLLAHATANDYNRGRSGLRYLWNIMYNLTSATTRGRLGELAGKLGSSRHMICIGRGQQHATALEAALKIKEVSYIHAEAFAGGELKHGSIALIEKDTPCIAFASERNVNDVASNAAEVRARGGYVVGVAPVDSPAFDYWIKVPECGLLNPIAQIVPMQILAYMLAVLKGIDPDHPRSLAKSVTVK